MEVPRAATAARAVVVLRKERAMPLRDAKGETATCALEATGPGALEKVGVKVNDVRPGDPIKVRCHLLKDGATGCLLGFVTPMHGDAARGHGIERDWDGGGGAGFPATGPFAERPAR